MRKYYAEFLGTFSLVFAGTGAIVINDLFDGALGHLGISLAFGLVVMVMIYSIGDVSGAHINPAVTLAFWVAKRLSGREVLPYIVFQLAGGVLASVLLSLSFPDHETLGMTMPSGSWYQTFIFELVLTFLLMFVILNVSVGAKEKGMMAGAAIGAMVALEALVAGPVTGASMNPARSLGPALAAGIWEHQWIYIVATTLGAVLAVFSCRYIQVDGCCDEEC